MLALALAAALQTAAPMTVPSSCADQWKAAHGVPPKDKLAFKAYQKDAKAFGLQCVFHTRNQGQPMTRAEVLAVASQQITETTPFVASPPKDIAKFCSRYRTMTGEQQLGFWRNMFVAIASVESGFKNRSLMLDYPEFSIGLYQVSIHNGCHNIQSEAELDDPAANTICAMTQMSKLASPSMSKPGTSRQGVIGGRDPKHLRIGAADYWSTLWITSPTRAAIIRDTMKSPGCAS